MPDTDEEKKLKAIFGLFFLAATLVVSVVRFFVGSSEQVEKKNDEEKEVVVMEYREMERRRVENEVADRQYFGTVKVQLYGTVQAIKDWGNPTTPARLIIDDMKGNLFSAYVLKANMPAVLALKRGDVVRVTCGEVGWPENESWLYVSDCTVEKAR